MMSWLGAADDQEDDRAKQTAQAAATAVQAPPTAAYQSPEATTGAEQQMVAQQLPAAYTPPAPQPQGGINPNQGGFRGPENPANLEPGPNADYGIFDYGKANAASSIPYVTPFIQNTVRPAVNEAITAANPYSFRSPGTGDQPQTSLLGGIVSGAIPATGLEALQTAAPFAGDAMDALRGARAGLEESAISGLEPRPGLPDMPGAGIPLTPSPAGGAAFPPGPRDPYNLFDAANAERAAEPAASDAAAGYKVPGTLGPDDINNPVNAAYRAQMAAEGAAVRPPPGAGAEAGGLPQPPGVAGPVPSAPTPEPQTFYHGTAGPIEGGELKQGTYLSPSQEDAQVFANMASRLNGNEPRVYTVQAHPDAVSPIEDSLAGSRGAVTVNDPSRVQLQSPELPGSPPTASSGLVDAQGRPIFSGTDVNGRPTTGYVEPNPPNIGPPPRSPGDLNGAAGIGDFAAQRAARMEPPFDPAGIAQRPLETPAFSPEGTAERSGLVQAPTRAEASIDAQEALHSQIASKIQQTEQGLGRDLTPTERLRIAEQEGAGKPPPGNPTDAGFWSGFLGNMRDLTGAPQALKVVDHLPFLRQGAASMFSDPGASIQGFTAGVKSFISQAGFDNAMQAVHNLPNYQLLKDAGLFESQTGPGATAATRESFQEFRGSGQSAVSKAIGAIPGEENTGRSFVAEMNTTRFVRANNVAQAMIDSGITPQNNFQAFKNLASAINNQTGHGPLGQGPMPLFFSMRALSGRGAMVTDLFTKAGNPLVPGAYREVVKGGLSQLALGGSLLGAATVAGASIDRTDGLPVAHWKGPFGTQTFDPWAGQNAIGKLIVHSVDAIKQGGTYNDTIDRLGGIYEQFARGELAPLQGKIADIVTGKDWKGDAVPGGNLLGRLKDTVTSPDNFTRMVAPFWAEAMYDGARQFGLAGAARATPSFLGGSVSEQDKSGISSANSLVKEAAVAPDALTKAFPNNPDLVKALNGVPYDQLEPKEKAALKGVVDPALLNTLESEKAKLGGPIYDTGKKIEAQDAKIQAKQGEYQQALTLLSDKLEKGQGDPVLLRQGITQMRGEEKKEIDDLFKEKDAIKADKSYQDALAKLPPSAKPEIGAKLDEFNSIKDLPSVKRPDGSLDYNRIDAIQKAYMGELQKSDPNAAARLAFLTEKTDRRAPMEQFIDEVVRPVANVYFNQPEGSKTQWLREHPTEEAKLWAGGYLPVVHSQAAAEYGHNLLPERPAAEIRR